jgi:hypothetical protein
MPTTEDLQSLRSIVREMVRDELSKQVRATMKVELTAPVRAAIAHEIRVVLERELSERLRGAVSDELFRQRQLAEVRDARDSRPGKFQNWWSRAKQTQREPEPDYV